VPETITLDFLAEQQRLIIDEIRSFRAEMRGFREDMEVQSAIIRRMDGTMQGVVGELRALAAQQSRLRQKVESQS
jgi:hypothetical protein